MKTNPVNVTKAQFVALLLDSGMTDAQMQAFHRTFEQRHPDAHETFLRALQIPEAEIAHIRVKSRN